MKGSKLDRKPESRKIYDRILIVCEGTKTEPNYFKEIKREERLPTADVQVMPSKGTAPLQVVNFAKCLFFNGNPHKGIGERAFDHVFIVFDRDKHNNYSNALGKIDRLNNKHESDEGRLVPFTAIPSNPCFELWLLLHYEKRLSLNSCKDTINKLEKHFAAYTKGAKNVYQTTKPYLDTASQRATNINAKCLKTTNNKPFTYINELVHRLKNLRK